MCFLEVIINLTTVGSALQTEPTVGLFIANPLHDPKNPQTVYILYR